MPGRPREVARAVWQQIVEIDDCQIQNPAYSFARAIKRSCCNLARSLSFYYKAKHMYLEKNEDSRYNVEKEFLHKGVRQIRK